MIRYLSLFSGIEAATVAWEPLGWTPAAFAEIEKFPSAVLKHRHPAVPNIGNVLEADFDSVGHVDLVVFGSPCQSFSVAGKRLGLDDPRGNLALFALGVVERLRPRWFLFENVPGLLSSGGGRDFGQFLATVGECGYKCAWRILDAQYFGVPQRRRRVFVVGYLGDWRYPAAVLFERHSLSGDKPPCRKAGTDVAHSLASCSGGCNDPNRAGAFIVNALTSTGVGTCGADDNQAQAGHIVCMATGQGSAEIVRDGEPSLTCNHEAPIIAHTLRGTGFDASEDGTGRGTPIIAVRTAQTNSNGHGIAENVAHTLDGANGQAVAFHHQNSAAFGMGVSEICPTLSITKEPAVAYHRNSSCMVTAQDDIAAALRSSGEHSYQFLQQAMSVRRLTPRECERLQGFPDDYTRIPVKVLKHKPTTKHFKTYPDYYDRNEDGTWTRYVADSARYKAIGNSMAVPVMRWIGERIQKLEELL